MEKTVHPEKGPYLQDLKSGQRFVGFYVVRNQYLEPFRDASRGFYLTMILSDASGQMVGRVWEDAQAVASEVQAGQVAKVEGDVDTYLDRPQVRILRVRPAKPGEYDRRDFLPSSKRDPAEMLAELDSFRGLVTEPSLRGLVDHFFTDQAFLSDFAQAPASRKVHHAYLGGLLEHTLQVLQLCTAVVTNYPVIDASLLISGAFLYEIGKLREFQWEMDLDYSDEGRLLGHIVLTDQMVSEALRGLPDFPPELALRLRHMLIAHHGRYEWGSPRQPQTLEAVVLHHVEDLDSQINRFAQLLESRPPEMAWTEFDTLLGRQLYGGPAEIPGLDAPDRPEEGGPRQP